MYTIYAIYLLLIFSSINAAPQINRLVCETEEERDILEYFFFNDLHQSLLSCKSSTSTMNPPTAISPEIHNKLLDIHQELFRRFSAFYWETFYFQFIEMQSPGLINVAFANWLHTIEPLYQATLHSDPFFNQMSKKTFDKYKSINSVYWFIDDLCDSVSGCIGIKHDSLSRLSATNQRFVDAFVKYLGELRAGRDKADRGLAKRLFNQYNLHRCDC